MATKTNETEQVRKLTLKTVGAQADIEKLLAADGKRMDLVDIYGIATKAKPGSSDHGPYVRFLGQFKAINLETKQVYEANVTILPKFFEEQLFAVLPEGGGNVEFAVRISAKFDKDAATKYVYAAKSLIPASEQPQLTALEQRVMDARKALPAPKS